MSEPEHDPIETGNGKPKREKKEKLSFLDRLAQQALGYGKKFGDDDDAAREKFPLLWELLCRSNLSQDRCVMPATMTISASPGGFVLSLTHSDLAYQWRCASSTLEGVFQAMEEELRKPNACMVNLAKREPKARKRKPSS